MTTKAQLERVPGMGETTSLFGKPREGDPEAVGELLSQVCREMRPRAAWEVYQTLFHP